MIVESPAKAKKIGGFLGPDYTVVASVGHIRSIAKNKTEAKGKKPIDTAHNFETVYVIDYRKWDGHLANFVTENSIDDVLFLNVVNTTSTSARLRELQSIIE